MRRGSAPKERGINGGVDGEEPAGEPGGYTGEGGSCELMDGH